MITLYTIGGILILVAFTLGLSLGRGVVFGEIKHKAKSKISIFWQGAFYQVREEGEMCDLERRARSKGQS